MEIIHDAENRTVKTVVDGRVAYVTYVIENGELDVRHTNGSFGNRGKGYSCGFG